MPDALSEPYRRKAAEFRRAAKTSNNPQPLLDVALEADARAYITILADYGKQVAVAIGLVGIWAFLSYVFEVWL